MARGYIYEISKDPEQIGLMHESDFYDKAGIYADYFQDLAFYEDQHLDLLECLKTYGCKIDINQKAFHMTQKDKEQYFEEKLKIFQDMAKDLTLKDFMDPAKAYGLSCGITHTYSDAVYYESSFYEFDAFMREVEPDNWYYIGNIVLMH